MGICCDVSSSDQKNQTKKTYNSITLGQLKAEIGTPNIISPLIIIDCGPTAKDNKSQNDFNERCIPNAVFLQQDLWITPESKKWDVPTKQVFSDIFKNFNALPEIYHFVCYDHDSGKAAMFAAMLLIMFGCEQVSVLNGKHDPKNWDNAGNATAIGDESKPRASIGQQLVDLKDKTHFTRVNYQNVKLAVSQPENYLILDCRPRMLSKTKSIPGTVLFPSSEVFNFHCVKTKETIVKEFDRLKVSDYDLTKKKIIVFGNGDYHIVKLVLEHYQLSGSDERGITYYPGGLDDWEKNQIEEENSKKPVTPVWQNPDEKTTEAPKTEEPQTQAVIENEQMSLTDQ